MYGVTSYGVDSSDVFTDVSIAGALLHAIVRHEARSFAQQDATVYKAVTSALSQLHNGHCCIHTRPFQFFNSFDVSCVLTAALHKETRGLRLVAKEWLSTIEAAGNRRRLVSAHKIAHTIKNSRWFKDVMNRGYAPGGRIAAALSRAYRREFD